MAMQLPANTTWFTFTAVTGNFSVFSFKGHEAVSEPFEFSIELVSHSANENLTELLGTEALLSIFDKSGAQRFVHGFIREMEQLHTANAYTHYRCLLVPRLQYLDGIRDHRIFQHLSVNQIIEKILKEQGFDSGAFDFKLFFSYEPREFCVQYGETDLHFISRLCEEEGIFYYFEHKKNSHVLCFSDREGGPKIQGQNKLRFFRGSGTLADTTVLRNVTLHEKIVCNSASHKEWNFTKPRLDLMANTIELDKQAAPAPQGMVLEQYRYPHLYQTQKNGTRYTEIQLIRQLSFRRYIESESDVAQLAPAHTFDIFEHPRDDINSNWWVYSVEHRGLQPGVLQHEAPDDNIPNYISSCVAIPAATRFVPEVSHQKIRIEGLQSAIITGPQGEEIFTDKYGRVKVQFHWDREGGYNENTSCWIRVADTWAGENFGSIRIPRIGQEVIVEFMEGNPDRPVITGRTYNENLMVPWTLPEMKSLSGIQSREIKASRRNQVTFDDTSGEIQAQISSDHDLSQLNLGYITRVNHVDGRKDFRGEGFELRTDGWGTVRAGKGLFISTHLRSNAEEHQKDIKEAARCLNKAAEQHSNQLKLAVKHEAQLYGEHERPLTSALELQNNQLEGSGKPHGEFTAPQLLIASAAGVALTAAESTHLHSADHTQVTAGSHVSIASGKSFLATATERISLFARSLGMKLFAGSGKVEIQAQTDDLDVIANKVLQIISMQENVHLSSPKEIILTAGGSYLKVNKDGVFSGTNGKFEAKASSHDFNGPASMPFLTPQVQQGTPNPQARLIITDELGRVLDLERDAVGGTGNIDGNPETHKVVLFNEDTSVDTEQGKVKTGGNKTTVITGNTIELSSEHADNEPQE